MHAVMLIMMSGCSHMGISLGGDCLVMHGHFLESYRDFPKLI